MPSNVSCEENRTSECADEARVRSHAEYEAFSDAFCRRLREGSLPPDEAYWWTRVLVWEAAAQVADLCRLSSPSDAVGVSLLLER
jgi:hypothetical protein